MKKVVKVIFSISFILYLFILILLLFIGNRGYKMTDLSLLEYVRASSNFAPFKTIRLYFQAIWDGSMNRDIPIKNLVGNLLMFLPMGIYLPFFIKRMNKANIFILSTVILLFFVETIQLVTRKGRFDVDDFILNMLGALMGFGIWKTKFVQQLLK